MLIEKAWEFSDVGAMPNNTSSTLGYVDLTTSYFNDWQNSGVDLWVVITCNIVPSGGTSIMGWIAAHTSTSVHSGSALMSGRIIPLANLTAGCLIFACPISAAMALVLEAEYLSSTWRYLGVCLTTVGDMTAGTAGKVDAHLRVGKPQIPTTMVVSSNI